MPTTRPRPGESPPLKKRLASLALRLWPYGAGLLMCPLLGLAERQSRQAMLFGEGMAMTDWFAQRLAGPWMLATTHPAEGWPAWVLLALLPLHLIWPRWWLAPVTVGTLIGWCFWGTQIAGRMA
jgi:hypothetical protein